MHGVLRANMTHLHEIVLCNDDDDDDDDDDHHDQTPRNCSTHISNDLKRECDIEKGQDSPI